MTVPRTIGPYEVLSVVGRGGMGVVLRGRHRELRCERAIKVLEDADPARLARFTREANALARVRHPNVVAVHEVGADGKRCWFAMDLVEGARPLDQAIREGIPLAEGLRVLEQVARGLEAVHEAGLVHRDVKPSNVVVDARGRAFLIDFGLVTSAEAESLTKSGALVGTPAYFAPEYVLGLAPDPDPRVDIYALGAMLYELATGTTPLEAETPQELFTAHASHRPIAPPSVRRPGVAPALDAVCARALAREPRDRYPSAAELAEDLALLAAGKPPSHASGAGFERARPGRGTWALVGAAGCSVVLLAAVLATRARPKDPGGARAADLAARLADLEQRARRASVRGNERGPSDLELAALGIGASALELAPGVEAAEARDLARTAARASVLAGELALRRHDLATAAARLESASALDPGERAPLEGGIAALASPATTESLERAERILAREADSARDRGDLFLWRAVERARRGQRGPARADAERARALGFDSRLDSLVVLALSGGAEEARHALESEPGLRDPAFARPFVARAAALVGAKGSEAEVLGAVESALRYEPAGSPDLAAVASSALARAREVGAPFSDPLATLEDLEGRLDALEALVGAARAASPDVRDRELALVFKDGTVYQGARGASVFPLRNRLSRLAVALDPGSFDVWLLAAVIANSDPVRGRDPEAHVALDHARALARTPQELAAVAEEETTTLWHERRPERIVDVARQAIADLERAPGVPGPMLRRLYFSLTDALRVLGRWQELEQACADAERQGALGAVRQHRAEGRAALGRLEDALADLRACVEATGTSQDVDYDRCARELEAVERRLGRPLDAIDADLARALHVASGDECRRILLRRAALALDAGQVARARAHVETAANVVDAEHAAEIGADLRAFDDPGIAPADLARRLRDQIK